MNSIPSHPSHLSEGAQTLYMALEQAAHHSAVSRGVGYGHIHEDTVGGFGAPEPYVQNPATPTDADKQARIDWEEGWNDTRAAFEELRADGRPVSISGGERDRFIAYAGMRAVRQQ